MMVLISSSFADQAVVPFMKGVPAAKSALVPKTIELAVYSNFPLSLQDIRSRFQDRLGVVLEIPAEGAHKKDFDYQAIDWNAQASSDAGIYLEHLEKSLLKYSRKWIEATGLKRIRLVDRIEAHGVARAALPDPKEGVLYFDLYLSQEIGKRQALYTDTTLDVQFAAYLRHVVHHEYFHLIDQHLHGHQHFEDDTWTAMNVDSQTYQEQGGLYAYQDVNRKRWSAACYPKPGFVTGYATTCVAEDKAEVFAFLMNGQQDFGRSSCHLEGLFLNDRVIRGKVWYLANSHPLMQQLLEQRLGKLNLALVAQQLETAEK